MYAKVSVASSPLRRVPFTNWESLLNGIKSTFELPEATPLTLAYNDGDGDAVVFDSQKELDDILNEFRGDNGLKIYAVVGQTVHENVDNKAVSV